MAADTGDGIGGPVDFTAERLRDQTPIAGHSLTEWDSHQAQDRNCATRWTCWRG